MCKYLIQLIANLFLTGSLFYIFVDWFNCLDYRTEFFFFQKIIFTFNQYNKIGAWPLFSLQKKKENLYTNFVAYFLISNPNVGDMQCYFRTSFRGTFDWYSRMRLWANGGKLGGIERERESQGKGGIGEVEFLHERVGGTSYEAQLAGECELWYKFHESFFFFNSDIWN